jgi:BirA family biotin operon repressor/biotin-[acetyl-CoA-carboxylase] ligase
MNPFNAPVYFKEETDSTMLDMSRLSKPEHGTVTAAAYQTHGRGRGQDRRWNSEKNKNLLFTIALNPDMICHPLVRTPLICGLALTKFCLNQYQLHSRLKWPNDILVDNRKISGILCEFRSNMIFAGIGINCQETEFPDGIKHKTTSLKLQDISMTALTVLEKFLPVLKETLERKQWKEEAQDILYGRREQLEIFEGSTEKTRSKMIIIKGLNDDGFLLARDLEKGKEMTITTGEISFMDFI